DLAELGLVGGDRLGQRPLPALPGRMLGQRRIDPPAQRIDPTRRQSFVPSIDEILVDRDGQPLLVLHRTVIVTTVRQVYNLDGEPSTGAEFPPSGRRWATLRRRGCRRHRRP